ncbi:MAG: ACT domain-containing protein [Catonella sp.]|uniref:ACT domain-containing protein n=1 Tax=Catonella sp. TaxID=2382125 RepID=UPI003FA098DD
MKRAVITAVGKDSVGRFAEICNYLAEKEINILDVSQTIVGGFFNIMLIVDISGVDNEFSSVVDGFMKLGEECDFKANIQREEIFDKMHRV